jgi:hypothetical protein
MGNAWSAVTSWGEVCARASGRRKFHSRRRLRRTLRRRQVLQLLRRDDGLVYGAQSRIARELGCHRSAICRDVAALLAAPPPIRHGKTTPLTR